MPDLIKRISDDDGEVCNDPLWHIMDENPSADTDRILCTGEALDANSELSIEIKTTVRGGITCNICLRAVRAYKAIKL